MSLRPLLLVLLVAGLGCDFHGDPLMIEPEHSDTASFEAGLGDWIPFGIDLLSPPVAWEVARSTDRASDGTQAIRVRLNNLNGRGKVVLERKYAVAKDQLYTVVISFDFATADFGDIGLWRILAGASPDSPTRSNSVAPRESTGNGLAADGGYRWLPKSYTMEARSDAKGEMFVHVGVWGTSEVLRTYYIDKLEVTLTRKGLSAP